MPEQDFQERTEKATSRRREKARERGQVARSLELNSAAVICLGFLTLYLMGPHLGGRIIGLMSHTMGSAPAIAGADASFLGVFRDGMFQFFIILLPIFVVMTVVALGVNIAQVGFMVTPKALEPRFDKLNVVKGAKRILSAKSIAQLIRDTLKLIVVAAVAYLAIRSEFESFFALSDQGVLSLVTAMGKLALMLAFKIGLVILGLAILDYLYQRHEYERSIRMSRQELKDELKDTEGSPQLKARVRQVQRELARSRMMKAVPTADVVITNPTEIAVALKYDSGETKAPYVVAKGERLIAEKIRELACEHGVPVVEDRPLARALFKMCDVGQMIPVNLYRAVAEVLAHVYRLKGKVVK